MPDRAEFCRGGVHALMGSLAFAACAYNAIRFVEDRQPRSAINACGYGLLWAVETFYQTPQHWQAPTRSLVVWAPSIDGRAH
jgi:hypothetical protein